MEVDIQTRLFEFIVGPADYGFLNDIRFAEYGMYWFLRADANDFVRLRTFLLENNVSLIDALNGKTGTKWLFRLLFARTNNRRLLDSSVLRLLSLMLEEGGERADWIQAWLLSKAVYFARFDLATNLLYGRKDLCIGPVCTTDAKINNRILQAFDRLFYVPDETFCHQRREAYLSLDARARNFLCKHFHDVLPPPPQQT